MPESVVFFVCIPTTNYEYHLLFGKKNDEIQIKVDTNKFSNLYDTTHSTSFVTLGTSNKMSISKSELNSRKCQNKHSNIYNVPDDSNNLESKMFISMEIVLDSLLKKLNIEHVVWCRDKGDMYYEASSRNFDHRMVIFPVIRGDACENCLHYLTEVGIGVRMNSIVSVIPTQCTYRNMNSNGVTTNPESDVNIFKEKSKNIWESFVSSIKSKLTVKQVIEGVRSGGDFTFDYVLLILTADCLAALGLVENSATNVVAAMLVSPLMGPVMSLTFGTIIMDRYLQLDGIKSLTIGIILSVIFGFIFGLILGTTEMPWGYNDWPTEEMKGRGNYRSLWMGILWALPSGCGVAIALLQGINGPLIGVAISASLLPPVVNCGLFWALGCIWLIYRPIKMLHLKGESIIYINSSYKHVYAEYIPLEFFCNGLISACLTFINVICIFITAIIILKIKEVAAPYTSSAELQQFWENDIRITRDNNIQLKKFRHTSGGRDSTFRTKRSLMRAVEEAISEAMSDQSFKKIRRLSYGKFTPNQKVLSTSEENLLFNTNSASRTQDKNHYDDYIRVMDDLDTMRKNINHLLVDQSERANSETRKTFCQFYGHVKTEFSRHLRTYNYEE